MVPRKIYLCEISLKLNSGKDFANTEQTDRRVSRNTGMTEMPKSRNAPVLLILIIVAVEKPECPCSRVNDDNLPGIPVFRHCKNKAKALDWRGPISRSVNARLLGIPVLIENLFMFFK